MDFPEWGSLETHRALLLPTSSIFAYYFDQVFQDRFRPLIFSIFKSEFATSAALQFIRTATGVVLSTYLVDDHVQIGKPLLVALRPSVVLPIEFMDIKELVLDHSYDLAAFIMA